MAVAPDYAYLAPRGIPGVFYVRGTRRFGVSLKVNSLSRT